MGYESVPVIRLMERHDRYVKEIKAIELKLSNGVPPGKEEKLVYRLNDIHNRLIPEIRIKTY